MFMFVYANRASCTTSSEAIFVVSGCHCLSRDIYCLKENCSESRAPEVPVWTVMVLCWPHSRAKSQLYISILNEAALATFGTTKQTKSFQWELNGNHDIVISGCVLNPWKRKPIYEEQIVNMRFCPLTFLIFFTIAYWMHHWPPRSQDQWDQANVWCPDQDCEPSGRINWPPGYHHRLSCQH